MKNMAFEVNIAKQILWYSQRELKQLSYIENLVEKPRSQGLDNNCKKGDKNAKLGDYFECATALS